MPIEVVTTPNEGKVHVGVGGSARILPSSLDGGAMIGTLRPHPRTQRGRRTGTCMKFDYKIYPEHTFIVLRLVGAFTLEELTKGVERLWSDPRYSRSYHGVIDLTDGTLAVGRLEFRALVDFVRGHKDTSTGRWAAVAGSPLAVACGMIYQRAVAGRHSFEVFSTFEAAGSFVGVDLRQGPLPSDALVWAG